VLPTIYIYITGYSLQPSNDDDFILKTAQTKFIVNLYHVPRVLNTTCDIWRLTTVNIKVLKDQAAVDEFTELQNTKYWGTCKVSEIYGYRRNCKNQDQIFKLV
jgi:hypothetical protein